VHSFPASHLRRPQVDSISKRMRSMVRRHSYNLENIDFVSASRNHEQSSCKVTRAACLKDAFACSLKGTAIERSVLISVCMSTRLNPAERGTPYTCAGKNDITVYALLSRSRQTYLPNHRDSARIQETACSPTSLGRYIYEKCVLCMWSLLTTIDCW
jgi:hypothetical protein